MDGCGFHWKLGHRWRHLPVLCHSEYGRLNLDDDLFDGQKSAMIKAPDSIIKLYKTHESDYPQPSTNPSSLKKIQKEAIIQHWYVSLQLGLPSFPCLHPSITAMHCDYPWRDHLIVLITGLNHIWHFNHDIWHMLNIKGKYVSSILIYYFRTNLPVL